MRFPLNKTPIDNQKTLDPDGKRLITVFGKEIN